MKNYKTIFEDYSTGKLHFGYITNKDEVQLISYSVWEKLEKPIKETDYFKKVKNYLLGKLSFNKQVEFNIASKSLNDITELDKIRLLYKLNSNLPKISKKGIKVN